MNMIYELVIMTVMDSGSVTKIRAFSYDMGGIFGVKIWFWGCHIRSQNWDWYYRLFRVCFFLFVALFLFLPTLSLEV